MAINLDFYIGKEFLYVSKYGSKTKGIVDRWHMETVYNEYGWKHKFYIFSTNNIMYSIDEIYFIDSKYTELITKFCDIVKQKKERND